MYVLGCCHVGRQSDDSESVLLQTAGGFLLKKFHLSFFSHDSFHLDKIASSRITEASSQHSAHAAVFHCRDSSLCCMPLLSPNISSISTAKEL